MRQNRSVSARIAITADGKGIDAKISEARAELHLLQRTKSFAIARHRCHQRAVARRILHSHLEQRARRHFQRKVVTVRKYIVRRNDRARHRSTKTAERRKIIEFHQVSRAAELSPE